MKTVRALLASVMVLSAGALISGCQSDPDIDITKLGLETDPPDVLYTQGLANMKAGNMDGFCVGEPWGGVAVEQDIGFTHISTQDLWRHHPE